VLISGAPLKSIPPPSKEGKSQELPRTGGGVSIIFDREWQRRKSHRPAACVVEVLDVFTSEVALQIFFAWWVGAIAGLELFSERKTGLVRWCAVLVLEPLEWELGLVWWAVPLVIPREPGDNEFGFPSRSSLVRL